MRLDDLVVLHQRREGFLPLRRERGAARGDEGGDAAAEGGRVDDDGGAADDAVALELVDPLGDGGAGEADHVGELGDGQPAVAEEDVDDEKILLVEIDCHDGSLPPSCRQEPPFTGNLPVRRPERRQYARRPG